MNAHPLPAPVRAYALNEETPMKMDDQPPGVDADDPESMPALPEAATRILGFVGWFGDGLIEDGGEPDGTIHTLYARDLEAVARAVLNPPASLTDVLAAHQLLARGMTTGSPDRCTCGELIYRGDLTHETAFAAHQAQALASAGHSSRPAPSRERVEAVLLDLTPQEWREAPEPTRQALAGVVAPTATALLALFSAPEPTTKEK